METQPKVNENEIFVKKVHKKLQKCYMNEGTKNLCISAKKV